MRVLCLNDSKNGSLEVIKIIEAGFEDDITDAKPELNEYNQYETKSVSGLWMYTPDGEEYFIRGISVSDCNRICEELLRAGYCDLRKYGEYEVL